MTTLKLNPVSPWKRNCDRWSRAAYTLDEKVDAFARFVSACSPTEANREVRDVVDEPPVTLLPFKRLDFGLDASEQNP